MANHYDGTMGRSSVGVLEAYVPLTIRRQLARDPTLPTAPALEHFHAAVFFSDVVGFTALTERLAQSGDSGAEAVQEVLNLVFDRLIQVVTPHGGEVVKFAGDAAFALWPVYDPEDLAVAVRRAAQCSLASQQALDGLGPTAGTRLRLRIGIGAGKLLSARVGGKDGVWDVVVGGEPIEQLARADALAEPGQIVLSAEAWAVASRYCSGRPLSQGGVLLESVRQPSLLPKPEPVLLGPEAEVALRAYIPPDLQARIDAGQARFLGEFRRVTVLFADVADIDFGADDILETLQRIAVTFQETVGRYDGSVTQMMVDDKGLALIAGWGLALHAHEDDTVRGLLAALSLLADLRRQGISPRVGVTTGRVFAGLRGNRERLEYAMIGDTVNLAARLREAASDEVLCDLSTWKAARRQIAFEDRPPLLAKGKSRPIAVFRPLWDIEPRPPRRSDLLGRETECALLTAELETVATDGANRIVLIEGEAGIGKSLVVSLLLEDAPLRGARSFLVEGNALKESTAYHAWQSLFERFLDPISPGEKGGPEAREQRLLSLFGSEPELLDRVALLRPIFPALGLQENERTREMLPEARADNTRDLLAHLFCAATKGSPTLVVLEDAHWLDSSSWALAEAISRKAEACLMILVTRPVGPEEMSEPCRRLRERVTTLHLKLGPLGNEEALDLVRRRLAVESLPPPVERLILEKAEGHPFFSEELAYALRDRGLLRIENGICHFDEPDAGSLDLPDSVQSVVASRIDGLSPREQLTLKVASVIGRSFDLESLGDVHPIQAGQDDLRRELATMIDLDLVSTSGRSQQSLPHAYTFKHAIIQDVAYSLLTYHQRHSLHRATAELLEQAQGDPTSLYPLLAHHWNRAAVTPKAIEYLTKAGDQALESYSNQEAERFFSEALKLVRKSAAAPQLASALELSLGKACSNGSKYAQAKPHIEEGLHLLGLPVPKRRKGQVFGIAGQILRQILHRARPTRAVGRSEADSSRLLTAASAYEGLVEIYYYTNEPVLAFYSALSTLNLAERAGASPQLARSYALAGTLVGFLSLHRLADTYCRRAADVAGGTENLSARLWVALVNGVSYTGVAEWPRVRTYYAQAVQLAERLGDERKRSDALGNLADVDYFQGRFAAALKTLDEVYRSSSRRQDQRYQLGSLRAKVFCHLALGDVEQAERNLRAVEETVQDGVAAEEDLIKMDCYGFGAQLSMLRGDVEGAISATQNALALFEKVSTTVSFYRSFVSCAAVTDVCHGIWEERLGSDRTRSAQDRTSARRALEALRSYARIFPIAQPAVWRNQGRHAWLLGRPVRARRAWRKSLAAARRLSMIYDEGLAELEIGRHLTENDTRKSHLTRAAEIFSRLDAKNALEKARREMRETP